MSSKRASDRDQFALAADVRAQRAQPVPEPATPAPAKASSSNVVRCGIALSSEDWALRGAFLADWRAGGTAETFPRWVEQAITVQVRRTPEQRAQLAGDAPVGAAVRSVPLNAQVVDVMHHAIEVDAAAGRVRSDRRWIGEALEAAVAAARRRDGDVTPAGDPPRAKLRRISSQRLSDTLGI